jgi:hypothetical protein
MLLASSILLDLVSDGLQKNRGMLTRFADMVAEVQILQHICKMFLNGLPTAPNSRPQRYA